MTKIKKARTAVTQSVHFLGALRLPGPVTASPRYSVTFPTCDSAAPLDTTADMAVAGPAVKEPQRKRPTAALQAWETPQVPGRAREARPRMNPQATAWTNPRCLEASQIHCYERQSFTPVYRGRSRGRPLPPRFPPWHRPQADGPWLSAGPLGRRCPGNFLSPRFEQSPLEKRLCAQRFTHPG